MRPPRPPRRPSRGRTSGRRFACRSGLSGRAVAPGYLSGWSFRVTHEQFNLQQIDRPRQIGDQPARRDFEDILTLSELARLQSDFVFQIRPQRDGVDPRVPAVGRVAYLLLPGFDGSVVQLRLKLLRAGHVLDLEPQGDGTGAVVVLITSEDGFQPPFGTRTLQARLIRGVMAIADVLAEIEQKTLLLAAERLGPAQLVERSTNPGEVALSVGPQVRQFDLHFPGQGGLLQGQ